MVWRFCLFLLLASSLFVSVRVTADDQAFQDSLYTEFLNPPREYSPMPFWFWNGELDGKRIQPI